MKKFIAILCSITLILGSMSVYGDVIDGDIGDGDVCDNPWAEFFTTQSDEGQETTTPSPGGETTEPVTGDYPGFNPADLTYTTIDCEGTPGKTLEYAVQSTTIEGLQPWYGDGGNTFQFAYTADAGDVSSVTVNGKPAADGVVTATGAGLIKVDPTKLAEDAYSVIVVKTENGEFTYVIKKGNAVAPETSSSSENETTTPGGDTTTPGGDITTPGGDITTAGGETTKDEETTTPHDYGFNPGDLTYNTIKCEGNESLTLDWAIQSSTVDGLTPWYGDGGNTLSLQFSAAAGAVTNVIVNGASPAEGLVVEQNLGIVKINPTKLPDNAYSVIEVTTETGAFVFVVKRGTPPVIPTTPDQGNQTTPDQGNQTTPDQGNQTTPDQGVQTTPDQGNQTTPDQGNQTTPNQGGQTTPNQGGQTTTPSGNGNTTTVAPTTKAPAGNVSVAKAKVKKVKKTLASKKAKITLKKIAGAKYQVKVSTTKKFKKKNTVTKKKVKKAKFTLKSKKIANKKVLYVKARAYKVVDGKTYYGKWSKVKKVKIKK